MLSHFTVFPHNDCKQCIIVSVCVCVCVWCVCVCMVCVIVENSSVMAGSEPCSAVRVGHAGAELRGERLDGGGRA